MKGGDCHDWDDDMWDKVTTYHSKLAIQWERKKEKKAKAVSSSSSSSGFPPSVSGPLCELSFSVESVCDYCP